MDQTKTTCDTMDFSSLFVVLNDQLQALKKTKRFIKEEPRFSRPALKIKLEEDTLSHIPRWENKDAFFSISTVASGATKTATRKSRTSKNRKRVPKRDSSLSKEDDNSKIAVNVIDAPVARPVGKEKPLNLPTKRPRRKYKFRNVAGGYVYGEQLYPARLPDLPEGILLGSHPSKQRSLIGFSAEDETYTPEQIAEFDLGCLPIRKLVLEQLGISDWMTLAKFKCEELDNIQSLSDPRIHDLGNEALRTYVVHFLKGNLNPDPERGDDCKGSPKLTPDQCNQFFTAYVWFTCLGSDSNLRSLADCILKYYWWAGWRIRTTPVVICAFEENSKPAIYRQQSDSPIFPNLGRVSVREEWQTRTLAPLVVESNLELETES